MDALNVRQRAVMDEVVQRLSASQPQVVVVTGNAGSGKTFWASRLPRALRLRDHEVLYVAPTNQAAQVLRWKLKAAAVHSPVGTIHGKFFTYQGDYHCRGCPGAGVCHGRPDACRCGEPTFEENDYLAGSHRVVVVDEASMVSGAQHEQVLRLCGEDGTHLVFVGDPAQLRPVRDEKFSVLDGRFGQPLRLKGLARWSKGDPLIAAGRAARKGRPLPGTVVTAWKRTPTTAGGVLIDAERIAAWWRSDAVILSHTNASRVEINAAVRRVLGRDPEQLEAGDRLVCLDNTHWSPQNIVFNGSRGTVIKATDEGPFYLARVRIDAPEPWEWRGKVWRHLNPPDPDDSAIAPPTYQHGLPAPAVRWVYGYAMTITKSQGSEWSDVLVYNDFWYANADAKRRLLYTAVTRARSSLTVVGVGVA